MLGENRQGAQLGPRSGETELAIAVSGAGQHGPGGQRSVGRFYRHQPPSSSRRTLSSSPYTLCNMCSLHFLLWTRLSKYISSLMTCLGYLMSELRLRLSAGIFTLTITCTEIVTGMVPVMNIYLIESLSRLLPTLTSY